MSSRMGRREKVVIAIDPHKESWTAAAVGGALQPLGTIRVAAGRSGYRDLRRLAAGWPEAAWTIEGAGALGAPLAARLSADGVNPMDVPAKLATRVRMLSTGHGRNNDDADAISVGVAAPTATGLNTLVVDEAITALRALIEHRDDVVTTRTQTVNRLHVLLTRLLTAGASRQLGAVQAARQSPPGVPPGPSPGARRLIRAG